ncbi:MAG: hypothetical protein IKE60_23005 [Reyranella sp.]|uniref:hypothetical protein n=1 Tax=Reyranella sp. TaxID=1929291 RepID=UPI001AC32838|nr:hypothetical protein [Reyranella sp.]MBN9542158.1 hypothetical protein [Alphaproteobacteria bacterium]MBR2817548.1 hypothetical protein [Reyranella sp.]
MANFLGSANILADAPGLVVPAGKRLVFRPQHATLSSSDSATLRGDTVPVGQRAAHCR